MRNAGGGVKEERGVPPWEEQGELSDSRRTWPMGKDHSVCTQGVLRVW